jgi:autotransporter-associated beta strand protein
MAIPPMKNRVPRPASFSFLLAISIAALFFASRPARAATNAIPTVFNNGATDMSVGTNYTPNIAPTTSGTYDVQLSGNYTGGTTFSINGAALTFGSLDDLDTQTLVISNGATNTAGTITLSLTDQNETAGAATGDLLYLKSGANLTIQNGAGASTTTLDLSNTGNIDNAGALSLSGSINITTGKTITFTGAGATTVSGNIGASSGAVTINDAGGSVTFSGTNAYTGTTTASAGTLLLNFNASGAPASNIINSGNAFTFAGGALTIKGAGGSASNTQTLGTITNTSNTGLSSLVVNDNGSSGATTLALGSGGLGGPGTADTLNIDLSQGLGGNANGDVITTTDGAATLGWATVKDATDTGFAHYNGSKLVRLTGQTTLANNSNTSATDYITGPTGNSTTGSPYLALTASLNPSYNTLTVNTQNATGANFLDLGGNTVTLTQKAILMTGNSADNFTIQNGQLGAAASTLIVQQMGTGALTIAGTVSSGAGGLTKSGPGTLILAGADTYTGTTSVNQGTLQLSGAGTLGGATSTLQESGAAIVDLNGTNQSIGALNGSGGFIENNSGSGTSTLTVAAGATSTVIADNNGSNTGGKVALTMNGAGTFQLESASTFSGGITIDAGTVELSNTTAAAGTGNITLGNTANGNSNSATLYVDISYLQSLNDNITVAAGSSGTLELTGNTGLNGATLGGTFTLDNSVTFSIGSGKTYAINGATTLGSGNYTVYDIATTAVTFSGGLALGGGTLTLDSTTGSTYGITVNTDAITSSGNLVLNAFNSPITLSSAVNNIGSITNSGAGTGVSAIGGAIGANVTGLTQNAATSELVVSASNGSFIGDTTLTSGTLDIQQQYALQNSVINMNGGTLVFGKSGNSFTTASIGGLAGAGNLNLNDTNTTPGALALTIGNSDTSYAGNTLNPVYSGALSNTNGSASLTKVGADTQTLSGANTYSGVTTVNAGTLEFAAPTALYDGSTSFWTGAKINVASGATLALGVGTGQFTAANVHSLFTGGIFNATSTATGLQLGATIAFDTTGGSFTQSSTIGPIGNSTGANGGAIGLTKLGANTLTLDQQNTYTGLTTVSQGTLIVSGKISGADAAYGTLGGNGTIVGTTSVQAGGALYPGANGATTGQTLTLQNTVTFAAGSTLEVNLDNNGDTADELSITGNLNIGSNDTLTLNLLNTTPMTNTFEIAAYSGTWNGAQFATVNGLPTGYQVDYTGDPGEILIDTAAIPEPQTWAIVLAGFGMLMSLQRRRRRDL